MPRACFRHYFYVIFFRSDLQRAIAFVLGDLGNAAYLCAMFVNKSNFFTPFYVARPNHVPGVCANLVHLHAPFLDIFLCCLA